MTATILSAHGNLARAIAGRRTWFLDLDGTLVDSATVHAAAFRDVLAAHAPQLAATFDYAAHAGRSTDDVFASLGVADPTRRRRLVASKQDRYRELVAAGRVSLLPDALELLDALAAGARTAYLVTSGSRGSVERVLDSCLPASRFTGVLTADDVTSTKPHPAIYREACGRWAADPGDVVVVEDSLHGATAGVAAALLTLQVHGAPTAAGAVPLAGLSDVCDLLPTGAAR